MTFFWWGGGINGQDYTNVTVSLINHIECYEYPTSPFVHFSLLHVLNFFRHIRRRHRPRELLQATGRQAAVFARHLRRFADHVHVHVVRMLEGVLGQHL